MIWLGCLLAGVALLALAGVLDIERGGGAHANRSVPVVNIGQLKLATTEPTTAHDGARSAGRRFTRRDMLRSGVRLRLARLRLDAAITTVSAAAGVMHIPRDPRTVGWWNGGSAPGDNRGSTVIVGHINFSGTTGALAVLPYARPGDDVVVTGAGHDVRYAVVAIRSYAKSVGIPAAVFSHTGPARLVLITCGGSFDSATGNYRDNIVLYARPA